MTIALVLVGCAVSVVIAVSVFRLVAPRAPARLMRSNYRGVDVPVVLGLPLAAAAITSVTLTTMAIAIVETEVLEEGIAVLWPFVLMLAAGLWDDLRGDERARGFKGHLGAARGRALTGGIVKIVGGALSGLAAAAFLSSRGAVPVAHVVEVVALVGLSANLINLLDRAPGRAAKVSLAAALPLLVFGAGGWAAAAAPVFAGATALLIPDLQERAMLGDAGANPLGAVLGVGLAASLDEPARLVAIVVLLALNLASEKWSFSKAIEASPPLRWLDGLGRPDQLAPK
jgi:hypothetical protein